MTTKMQPGDKGHPAADLLQELADVARENPRPWEEFESCDPLGGWDNFTDFDDLMDSLVDQPGFIRRRPRTKRIGNYDVPLPVREPLEKGQWYYVAYPTHELYFMEWRWEGERMDRVFLRRRLIHLDPESAETHGRALARLMQEGEG